MQSSSWRGENTVRGGYENYPGIYVPVDHTLTIGGTGSLNAAPNANGRQYGCGIGGGSWSTYVGCGNINVSGGTINARGGTNAPGIGSGCFGGCGDITIADTVILVTATKGTNAPNSIGAADSGSCGTIIIADPSKVTQN